MQMRQRRLERENQAKVLAVVCHDAQAPRAVGETLLDVLVVALHVAGMDDDDAAPDALERIRGLGIGHDGGFANVAIRRGQIGRSPEGRVDRNRAQAVGAEGRGQSFDLGGIPRIEVARRRADFEARGPGRSDLPDDVEIERSTLAPLASPRCQLTAASARPAPDGHAADRTDTAVADRCPSPAPTRN